MPGSSTITLNSNSWLRAEQQWPYCFLLLFSATFICGAAGLIASSSSSTKKYHEPNSSSEHQQRAAREPNFHKVLERVGKTVFRPGGSDATKRLIQSANLTSQHSVLELSAGLGSSSISIAKTYGCHVIATDIDQDRLTIAAKNAHREGLDNLVQTKQMDMFHIDESLGQFDCAVTEASLTHFPWSRKVQFFKGIAKHSKQFLLHEVCFTTNSKEESQKMARKEMSKVLNIGFFPETVDNWKKLLQDEGFTIEYCETGNIVVLNPFKIAKEEGPANTARILSNLVTQPYVRSRVLATRKVIGSYQDCMGYVTIHASKK